MRSKERTILTYGITEDILLAGYINGKGIAMEEKNQNELADSEMGDELYNLLGQLLNLKMNRLVQNSLRGEQGVLRYLCRVKDGVTAGVLSEKLHVVPGRMTDILVSLEHKGYIKRQQGVDDRRKTLVFVTEEGRVQEKDRREYIRKEYQGMFELLGKDGTKELIRLLKIVLTYPTDCK